MVWKPQQLPPVQRPKPERKKAGPGRVGLFACILTRMALNRELKAEFGTRGEPVKRNGAVDTDVIIGLHGIDKCGCSDCIEPE